MVRGRGNILAVLFSRTGSCNSGRWTRLQVALLLYFYPKFPPALFSQRLGGVGPGLWTELRVEPIAAQVVAQPGGSGTGHARHWCMNIHALQRKTQTIRVQGMVPAADAAEGDGYTCTRQRCIACQQANIRQVRCPYAVDYRSRGTTVP